MNRDRRDNNYRRGDGERERGIGGGPRRENQQSTEIRRSEEQREPKREKSYELPKLVENSGPVSYIC